MADGSAQASAPNRGAAASGPDPLIGRLINERFKVVALIARGGMGKVYRAEQAPLGRTCALKVLNPRYAGDHDPEFHKRFFLEASIASKLTHPNTVTIFDYGRTDDDVYYMSMEYLEGRTLHRCIREEGPFNEERCAHIARQICRSLREAHSMGVIHRDLKPANVFLVEHADEHDFVKVLDFGLVKNVSEKGEDLTQAGLFMGSPKYMAPEQIKGDRVDGRTDIYALGIIMYEMITGKVPFDRPNSVHIMMAHVNEAPPPLRTMRPDTNVAPVTEELIFRCLEKEPDKRFASMEQLLNFLKGVGGGAMTATLSGVISSGDFLAATSSTTSGRLAPASGSGPSQPMFLSPSGTSQSGPVLEAELAPKKGSKGVLAAAVAAVLVLGIGGAAFFATRSSQESAAATPSPTETATAEPTVVPTASEPVPAVPAAPKVAAVAVETDPVGATVESLDGKELCTPTPCEIKFEGDEVEADKSLKIKITMSGYKDEETSVKPSDGKIRLRLATQPKKVYGGGGRPAPQRPPGGAPPPGGTPPAGFKDIPY